MHYPTLPAALEQLSGLDRTIRLIDRGGEASTRTFAGLRSRAFKLLRHFQSRGLASGDEMLLVLNRNDAFLEAYWACLYGGIVPVPLAPGITDEQRRKIFRVAATLQRPHLFTEHGLAARLDAFARQHGLEHVHHRLQAGTVIAETVPDDPGEGAPADAGSDDTAFIQFSSGSTSDPKGVVLTHHNLLANIRDMIDTAGLRDTDRGLSWMPLTHDMGLVGFHLMMVLAGMEHTIIATDAFIRRPMRWLRTASEHRASVLCSPNFGFRYLLKSFSPDKADDIDLSPVRIIFNGAEPISAPLCEAFLDAMAPLGLKRTAMYPVYGLAEASLAVSFPPVERLYRTLTVDRHRLGFREAVSLDAPDNPLTLVNVGRPIGACELRIGDDQGDDLGAGTVGRILIRGPNVTAGFYRAGGLSHEAFRGDWLDTGDLGFVHAGDLYVTGRTKDVIFVNGQNHYAHDLEAVACETEGLELGKVAAAGARSEQTGDDELVLFVLHRGQRAAFEALARAAARHVVEHAGAEVAAAVPVSGIPKTTSGKLRRFGLQQDYERGAFRDIALRLSERAGAGPGAAPEGSSTEAFLQQLCADALDGLQVGRDDDFFNLGVSSLKLIEIHEHIEQRFPGRIEVTDLFDYPSIRQLAGRLDGTQR